MQKAYEIHRFIPYLRPGWATPFGKKKNPRDVPDRHFIEMQKPGITATQDPEPTTMAHTKGCGTAAKLRSLKKRRRRLLPLQGPTSKPSTFLKNPRRCANNSFSRSSWKRRLLSPPPRALHRCSWQCKPCLG